MRSIKMDSHRKSQDLPKFLPRQEISIKIAIELMGRLVDSPLVSLSNHLGSDTLTKCPHKFPMIVV